MEFNEKMQELRKRKGLTQEELAEALFVSRTAISKWESGRGYPNIDSLKAIAKYFGVTIDELLSGDELLTLAQEDTREKEQHTLDLVFGLLDVSMVLLLFLPLFGQRADGAVRAVPLPALGDIRTYLLAAYWLVTAGTTALGVITLALQNCRHAIWVRGKQRLSLLAGGAGLLLFIVSQQPYAAVLTFAFLTIKALMLLKRR